MLSSSPKASHKAVSLIPEHRERHTAEGIALEKENRQQAFAAKAATVAKKATKQNTADEVELWTSVEEVDSQLEAIQSSVSNRSTALSMQVRGRIDGKGFVYEGLDAKQG